MKVHAPRPFTQLNGQEASLSHITPETATRGRQEGGLIYILSFRTRGIGLYLWADWL